MWILVDIGNTRTKCMHYVDGCLEAGPVFPTHAPHDFDELFERRPTRVLVSNVAGEAVGANLVRAVRAWCGVEAELARPVARLGDFATAYREPGRLGVDRWLAALGAWRDCRGPCCVIDMGTALTVDIVTAGGEHLGGLIAPGLDLMRTALTHNTAQLESERVEPVGGFADNTADAISLGCWSAVAGLLAETRQRLDATTGCADATWYLTGGGLPWLERMVSWPARSVPELVQRGLVAWAEARS